MRKSYAYVVTLVLLILLAWAGYCIYTAAAPKEYENGTFVELPEERPMEMEYFA